MVVLQAAVLPLQLGSFRKQEVVPKFFLGLGTRGGTCPTRDGCSHVAVEGQENTNYPHLRRGQCSPEEPWTGHQSLVSRVCINPVLGKGGGVAKEPISGPGVPV